MSTEKNLPSSKPMNASLPSEEGLSAVNSGSCSNPELLIYSWPIDSSSKYIIVESMVKFIERSIDCFTVEFPTATSRIVTDADEIKHIKSLFPTISEERDLNVFCCQQMETLLSHHFCEKIETYREILKGLTAPPLVEEPTFDKRRLADMRRRAMKSAAEWNKEMNKERKIERKQFFEHQTMLIHHPNRKAKNHSIETNFGLYPAALIYGQYQNFCKKYSTAELNRLPVNTAIDGEFYRPIRDCPSPEAIVVSEVDLLHEDETSTDKNVDKRKSSVGLQSTTDRISVDAQNEVSGPCAFCCEDIRYVDKWIQCFKCSSLAHKSCLDMSDTMYQVVKSYSWMCIECKPCSICSKLDEEDKMLFCDRCDRGYHTFCVGLNRLPSGRWNCQKYCATTSDQQQNPIMLNFSCLNDDNNDDASNGSRNTLKDSISDKSSSCVKCGYCIDDSGKSASRITRKKKKAQICDDCRSSESKKSKISVKFE